MENGIPTLWQTVIFRNYGLVPSSRIAEVIKTDETTVVKSAETLGLKNVEYDKSWCEKGFVTVIRNNWDIISLGDIAVLLGITSSELNALLVDYDFLGIKLGEKPKTGDYAYKKLTETQLKETEKIRKTTESLYRKPEIKPFDFYANYVEPIVDEPKDSVITERFTSFYSGSYIGGLNDDELKDYPESYLYKLSKTGVNGIWLHDTLRSLAEFPFDKELSKGYEKRVENLRKLTERCAKFGVNVYLYLNEPRSMPEEFFVTHPELKGQKVFDGYCLCTSTKEVQDYLYNAMKSVAEKVPLLKGVMTITMSENATNCFSHHYDTDCPRCAKRGVEVVVPEVNNILNRALKDGNGYTKLIANLWAWAPSNGWTFGKIKKAIENLDKDIEVLCVSETNKKFRRGKTDCRVIDYSISVVGPSPLSEKILTIAKNCGHKIWAKIQVNNSWECSGVPYVPVFDLMKEHIEKVKKLGVSGLMMSWSLGGYPGGALPLCVVACGKNPDYDGWYNDVYKDNAEKIKTAVKIFSSAYKEYPFSINTLYFAGQNLACGNLWSLEKSERESTMVCFTFDDYEKWSEPYGVDIYISQMKKLTTRWEKGLEILEHTTGNQATEELKRVAEGSFIHLKSAENLAVFVRYKSDLKGNRDLLLSTIENERELCIRLIDLIGKDAKIGYEISNHYFYNFNSLAEKIINLNFIERELKNF